ncbi:MAG: hypothetical protein JSS91_06625 [Bacteroidetes bacterium]|nr:hypothetical protein [Bacteroidota bacterium]
MNLRIYNMYIKFSVVLLIFFLSGCDLVNKIMYKDAYDESRTVSAEKNNLQDKNKKPAEKKDSVIRTFEGLVTINSDERSFRDCSNPDSLYLIKDESGNLVNEYKKLMPLSDYYGSLFAAVKGFTVDPDSTTDTEKYLKTIVVKEVITVEKKNFRNTCIPFEFWCLGNEPNWSLEISKEENIIQLTLPSDNKSYYFFYSEPKEEDGMIKYFGYNNIQRTTINISLRKESCSDNMSDRKYDYSVQVDLNGKNQYRGCAIKGDFPN